MSPTRTAARAIDALVEAGHTVRELEVLLGLSRGYLSKVRHGAATPSAPLVALLEVLRVHREAFPTIRALTAPEPEIEASAPTPGLAMRTLGELVPELADAGVRWAVTGEAALRLHLPTAPQRPGVDVLVDSGHRHVLELLRRRGHALAHHPPGLAICRLPSPDPNESLRIHFASRPPLSDALDRAEVRRGLPVVDLVTLTLSHLLSHRSGAEDAARLGVRGGASIVALRERLAALAALPEPRSPYVLRTFDRALAGRRLEALT